MADTTQSYKNHARCLPLFHFFVMPVLLRQLPEHGAALCTGADARHGVAASCSPWRC